MNNIDTMSVNAIRVLSADAIQKAKSGHPGLPLGCASVAYELWAKHLKHNPKDPDWKDRDLLYSFWRTWFYAFVLPASPVWLW